jgi:hypothetical protein
LGEEGGLSDGLDHVPVSTATVDYYKQFDDSWDMPKTKDNQFCPSFFNGNKTEIFRVKL